MYQNTVKNRKMFLLSKMKMKTECLSHNPKN